MTELGHLMVAHWLHRQLEWPEETRAELYVGCIAPDAYRVTTGIDYREAHFRNAREPGQRLTDFLRLYLRPAIVADQMDTLAFLTGWLSHVCADYVWRQQIRGGLPKLWDMVLHAPRLEAVALRHQFHDECDWADIQLYQSDSATIDDIRWVLSQALVRHTVPPLRSADIFRWREQVVAEMLPPANYTVEAPQFITLEFVQQTLGQAAEEALGMLQWESKLAREAGEGPPA
jgi:hypothetical protein